MAIGRCQLQKSDIFGEKSQKSDMIGEKLVGLPSGQCDDLQVGNVVTSYQQIPWSSVVITDGGTSPMNFSCLRVFHWCILLSFLKVFPCTKTFYLDIIQRSRL